MIEIFDSTAFLASVFMLALCLSISVGATYGLSRDVIGAVLCSLLGMCAFFGMLFCWFWPLVGRLV